MKFSDKEIRNKIESSLKACKYSKRKRQDIAFHMVDWLDDFSELYQFYRNPKKYKANEVEKLLLDCLVHVPNHIAAAAKLMTEIGVSDIFEVGAVEIDSGAK